MSGEAIIEVRGLYRAFGTQQALAGFDLQVSRGEIFGVLGPDGAGKTTLMQCLAAILDPSEGACRILGFDTVRQAAEVTSRIGYMSQGFTLYDRLSVDENLVFAARIRGVPDSIFCERRQRLLEMAGLTRFGARRAGELSGGMRKKLSLCTNLIHEPLLLLLDEPSLGVDPLSRRELWRMLRAFREQGTTVVLTTPYMDEAAYCERLAFLHQGRILAVDSPAGLRARAEGSVYRLSTAKTITAKEQLDEASEVIGVQWLPGRLVFQLAAGTPLPGQLRTTLEGLGTLQPVAAELEHAFVQLVGGGRELRGTRPAPPPAMRAAPATIEAIAVADLSVHFGDFTAVDGVTVSVAAGEVIGWLGPNGAGKTTLIRALCGLQRPTAGSARVAGQDIAHAPLALRQHIGYMSQRFSLYPDLTVAENLAFFAGAYGLRGEDRRSAMAWAVDMTGLEGTGSRWVGDLSGAQRQRLALACAVMHQPQVLFLDEPTSGVDPTSRQRFWELIQTLARGGMAVLVTTHYLEEARYCHRLGLMFQGRLIALGTRDELQAEVGVTAGEGMEAIFMAYMERERSPGEAAA